MVTTAELRRFAFKEGPGRAILGLRDAVDDSVATTSLMPPAACRGASGHPLPFGTTRLLEGVRYPAGRIDAAAADGADGPEDVLGHVLLAAFGIQRREPSSRYNDHRVTASVRSKFSVHCFVLDEQGFAYLDLYRHALIDIDIDPTALPERDGTTIVLAGRYTDYPNGYGWLRGSLTDLEAGINLRSLFVAAELFGVSAALDLDGARSSQVADLIRATGPGQWTPPLLVSVGASAPQRGTSLPAGAGGTSSDDDELLGADSGLHDAARVAATRYEIQALPAAPSPGLPPVDRPDGPSWSQVLWNRSAGGVAQGLHGFSVLGARYGRDVLDDHIAAATTPPPHPLLADVHKWIQLSVALQRVGDTPAGLYRLGADGLTQVRADEAVMQTVENAFGYAVAPDTDSSIRHAGLVWMMSVDLPALVAEFGPQTWTLLQLTCGWISHGLSVAAAAHGQFARPVLSFDVYRTITCFDLQWHETPSFMVIAGRSRFTEPMLDLRT